jgi:hypothetical protein
MAGEDGKGKATGTLGLDRNFQDRYRGMDMIQTQQERTPQRDKFDAVAEFELVC